MKKSMIRHIATHFAERHPLHRLEAKRKLLIAGELCLPNYFRTHLEKPYPSPKEDSHHSSMTVVDFETSGFDPENDHIVSIGWVNMIKGVIKLSSAQHLIINEPNTHKTTSGNPKQQTARALHHILPEQQKQGVSIETAMQCFFESLPSNILIAHGTTIEKRFLEQFFVSQQLPKPTLVWIDTLKIEQNSIDNKAYLKDFRLATLRRRYSLPDYPAHHALMDAIATAELFLAQRKKLFRNTIAPIGILYQKSK